LVGPADSNFGGGGMGIELGTEIFDHSEALLQSHVRLSLLGHFNGVGFPSGSGSPPRGELAGQGTVGLGLMGRAGLRSGFSPFFFVHPIALEISNVGGGAIWAYQPELEVGFLVHSDRLGSALRLSARGGGDLLYANGPLSLLQSPGQSDTLTHWRVDPLLAAGALYDQRFSDTWGVHMGVDLSDVTESLGVAGNRQILRGQAWLFLRIGGLLTGPELTFISIGSAPSGSSYFPVIPETNVTWMIGI
jgi:hypothetical protein